MQGTRVVAQRAVNAEERFLTYVQEQGFTREQAVKVMAVYVRVKAVKFQPLVGQFTFTHGGFAEKDVMTNALSFGV